MQPALAPAPHPSMQTSAQDHADQALRDQLVAAQQHLSHPQAPRPAQASSHPHINPTAAGARDQSNIDPAISGASMLSPTDPAQPTINAPGTDAPSAEQGSPSEPRKTYGKRELSTSKRAAQNRAAQRAFRQRKEGYIRKLEEQVKDYELLSENYKVLQAENYQLREYIINLQSRLIDSQNEVPELPGNIDLSQPRPEPPAAPGTSAAPSSTPIALQQQTQPSTAPSSSPGDDLNQLNRIAVAGLGMRKHHHDGGYPVGGSYQPKRMRKDGSSHDTSPVAKSEAPNGLPVVT